VWIDNFSKLMSLNVPTLREGAWQDCAWTGRALRKYPYNDVNMDILLDKNGKMIPCMPDDPFKFVDNFKRWFVKYAMKAGRKNAYDESLAVTMDVRCVPLKPSVDNLTKAQHVKSIEDGCDKLDSMFPTNLIKQNIGSNIGLVRIMRSHLEDKGQDRHPPTCSKYTAFNVDCNIFDRMLKVQPENFSWY
jgi:hypothetical protein